MLTHLSRTARISLLVLALAIGGGFVAYVKAQSAPAPSVSVNVGDNASGCGEAGATPTANPDGGWTPLVGDGGNNKDFDCIKVGLSAGSSFTRDFRVGLQLSDDNGCSGNNLTNVSWSGWASQGGGWGEWAQEGSSNDNQNCARVRIETRPLPSGVQIRNARLKVQVDGSGLMAYSPWTAAGGGLSSWAYKTHDVHKAKIGLEADVLDPSTLDARYVATTIPATATPQTLYGNTSVTMRNTGSRAWQSLTELSRTSECDSWNVNEPPQEDGASCTFTRIVTSQTEKLMRRDGLEAITLIDPRTNAPATAFQYERVIQVTYTSRAVTATICPEPPDPPNPNVRAPGSWIERLVRAGVPAAWAAPQPPPPGQPCVTYTYYLTEISETPAVPVQQNVSAVFPFKLRTSAPGDYVLRFQMGTNLASSEPYLFGEEAQIPISVSGTSTSSIGILCQAPAQVVTAGMTAPYPVTVSAQNTSATTSVTVTASGLPANATAEPRTVSIGPSGSATIVMSVVTASNTPAGSSTITFAASAAGMQPGSCNSNLTVGAPNEPLLWVSPSLRLIDVGAEANYVSWYDPDGLLGPGTASQVTGDSTWSLGTAGVAEVVGPGRMRGTAVGNTQVRASYSGMQAIARLNVTGEPVEPPGNPTSTAPTMRISPLRNVTTVGGIAPFEAFYDPDGSGSQTEQNVTAASTWSAATSNIAASLGGGRFRGVAAGETGVAAAYAGLTRQAELVVSGTTGGGACTFAANPRSLLVPPLKTTTLNWSCDEPTTCTVSNDTEGGSVIGTGTERGSVPHQPPYTTTYRLSCYGGNVELTDTVRVFDVRTRVEIAPR